MTVIAVSLNSILVKIIKYFGQYAYWCKHMNSDFRRVGLPLIIHFQKLLFPEIGAFVRMNNDCINTRNKIYFIHRFKMKS